VLDTSPELQHEFCELWNELVHAISIYPWFILRPIRNVYLTLHLHTDSAPAAFSTSTADKGRLFCMSSYPHIPSATSLAITQTRRLKYMTPLPPQPLLTLSYAMINSSTPMRQPPTCSRVYNNHGCAPYLCSSAPLHRYLSNDPSSAGTISAETIAPSTRETSTPTSSVILPAAVSPHDHTELLVCPDAPEIMSSEPPEPVLDSITGPSPLTNHILSPESHCARLVTISPGTSLRPASAPGLDMAKGSTEASSHRDEDVIDPASETCIIQANATVILDVPSVAQFRAAAPAAASS
jgi:hypothetical protein